MRFWDLFRSLLQNPLGDVNGLIELLEIIAITLRGTPGTNFGQLRQTFDKYWNSRERFFKSVWPTLRAPTLRLPLPFPSGLKTLSNKDAKIRRPRHLVACLVVHQFLCPLTPPPQMIDRGPDFQIWYSSGSPHPNVVKAYLFALFRYFGQGFVLFAQARSKRNLLDT